MTTTDVRLLYTRARGQRQAEEGAQRELIISEVPAGAEALIGKSLNGQVLTVNGDYQCLLCIAGLASTVRVNVKATYNSMTLTSAGPDELSNDFNPRTTNIADGVAITLGTGDGLLVDGTLQTAVLTPTGGRYARYTVTAAGSPTSVTMTIAEWEGA